jgi:hypothetical protein
MTDDELDELLEDAWDAGYRAAITLLLEADDDDREERRRESWRRGLPGRPAKGVRSSSTRSGVDDSESVLGPTPRRCCDPDR